MVNSHQNVKPNKIKRKQVWKCEDDLKTKLNCEKKQFDDKKMYKKKENANEKSNVYQFWARLKQTD